MTEYDDPRHPSHPSGSRWEPAAADTPATEDSAKVSWSQEHYGFRDSGHPGPTSGDRASTPAPAASGVPASTGRVRTAPSTRPAGRGRALLGGGVLGLVLVGGVGGAAVASSDLDLARGGLAGLVDSDDRGGRDGGNGGGRGDGP